MDTKLALQHRTQVEELRRKHPTALLTRVFTDIVDISSLASNGTCSTPPCASHQRAVAFSPDGQTLDCSIADQNGVYLWSVEKKTLITSFPRTWANSCLAFSPDGLLLAGGNWGGRA